MLLTTDMIVREAVNGAWFLLNLYMVGIFSIYLWPEVGSPGWFSKQRNKAAIGLTLYFVGGTMFHGWIWYLLRMARMGVRSEFLNNSYMVIVASGVFACVGSVFCIITFSEKRWSHIAWMGSVLLVGAFLAFEIFT